MTFDNTTAAFASIRDEGFSEHDDDAFWTAVQALFSLIGASPECANLADAISSDTGANDESASIIACTIIAVEACASMNDSSDDHRPIHRMLLATEAAVDHHAND